MIFHPLSNNSVSDVLICLQHESWSVFTVKKFPIWLEQKCKNAETRQKMTFFDLLGLYKNLVFDYFDNN